MLRKLNYTRRHNENPAINPRDVESSGGSCVRGLGVLVPAKPHYSHQETVFYEAESLFNIRGE